MAATAFAAELSPQARRDLSVLVTAYPGFVTAIEVDRAGRATVVLYDGVRVPYDDGRIKSDQEALAHPDIRAMPSIPASPAACTSSNPRPTKCSSSACPRTRASHETIGEPGCGRVPLFKDTT